MSPKTKTKEQTSKTTQTAPTPSESTKNFEKRLVTDYFYSPTKYNMSSKDWSAALKVVELAMSEEQGMNTSINF